MVRFSVGLRAVSMRAAQDLLETLRFLMASTRLEPGCLECTVWLGPDNTVHYGEAWESEDSLRHRVLSAAFTSLLALMECASECPDVEFDLGTSTRGLDFVTEVRIGAEVED